MRVRGGRPVYALLYMFFWPWNAPYEMLPGHPFGAHVADLEHVRIIVDKDSERITEVRSLRTFPLCFGNKASFSLPR